MAAVVFSYTFGMTKTCRHVEQGEVDQFCRSFEELIMPFLVMTELDYIVYRLSI